MILINCGDYDQFPVYDPVITAAEHTVGRDVHTAIIDGRVVMKDRQLLTVDLGPMRERVKKQYAQIMERFDNAIA
jgi:5-methylthioadenosine/S-adenosylhomocysteine deaminase